MDIRENQLTPQDKLLVRRARNRSFGWSIALFVPCAILYSLMLMSTSSIAESLITVPIAILLIIPSCLYSYSGWLLHNDLSKGMSFIICGTLSEKRFGSAYNLTNLSVSGFTVHLPAIDRKASPGLPVLPGQIVEVELLPCSNATLRIL